MARPRKEYSVRGPYKHGRKWRIEIIGMGARKVESFTERSEAEKAKRDLEKEMPRGLTMQVAHDNYRQALIERGCKQSTITRTLRRLRAWHDPDELVKEMTAGKLAARYRQRVDKISVDGHRNELKEVKAFWRWMRQPIADKIEPVGRRKRGKPQLRRSEARKLYEVLYKRMGLDEGALAVMCILLLGVRSCELLARKARDIDVSDDSVLLWIDEGKTRSASRHIELPAPIAIMLARRVRNLQPADWLWPGKTITGHRRHSWLIDACKRLCEIAEVPVITPQGLRGTWSTLTREAGTSSAVIAADMGHASDVVTKQHYIKAGADERAKTRRMLKVVDGGKG